MNEGIRIISEIPVTDFNVLSATIIAVIIIVIGCVICGILEYITGWGFFSTAGVVAVVIVALMIGVAIGIEDSTETGDHQYEIEVDENVKLVDFAKKYEIISIKSDNVFIVRKRDINDTEPVNEDTKETTNKKDNEVNLKEEK